MQYQRIAREYLYEFVQPIKTGIYLFEMTNVVLFELSQMALAVLSFSGETLVHNL